MKKRATLKDVAKEAGVNFTLVSKFLTSNPSARMGEATRARIEAALKKLDYRPSSAARALRNGKTRAIGMVVRDLTNPYYAHIADLALRELRASGYQLLIALDEPEDPDAAAKSLVTRGVDAIIHLGEKCPNPARIPCPVVVNDARARGAVEIDADLSKSLDEAFRGLGGKIAGLFFGGSRWAEEFAAAAERARKNRAFVQTLPFDREERREVLRAILAKKPDAIVASGWHTFTILCSLLSREFKGISPKIVVQANCAGDFLADKRLSGAIISPTGRLVRAMCQAAAQAADGGAPKKSFIPTSYATAGSPELKAVARGEFRLT
ncbi:MAG: LacI family DNA-binding transcriptional regulator [Opitutales bacterium]|nr:LacI family DNA-binding transcriptional regulator [Opitutales bacterium]